MNSPIFFKIRSLHMRTKFVSDVVFNLKIQLKVFYLLHQTLFKINKVGTQNPGHELGGPNSGRVQRRQQTLKAVYIHNLNLKKYKAREVPQILMQGQSVHWASCLEFQSAQLHNKAHLHKFLIRCSYLPTLNSQKVHSRKHSASVASSDLGPGLLQGLLTPTLYMFLHFKKQIVILLIRYLT